MKQKQIKSIIKLFGMCLVMMFYFTATVSAQKKHLTKNNKKAEIVTPVKHYKSLPQRGAQVASIPSKAITIKYNKYNYHYNNGVFYKSLNGSFVVVVPPIGISVSALPSSRYRFTYTGIPFYYYYGTYYKSLPNGAYEVVEPPIGARVDALPSGFEIFELDGMIYYKLGSTFYKAVTESNGSVVYEIVRV